MESSASPELLDALDRQIRALQEEEQQLARRAGEAPTTLSTSSSSSIMNGYGPMDGIDPLQQFGGVNAIMQRQSSSGSGRGGARDSVAAHALLEVRGKLKGLQEERAKLGVAVAAEKEEAQDRLKLK